jgi:hypothetical protein
MIIEKDEDEVSPGTLCVNVSPTYSRLLGLTALVPPTTSPPTTIYH